MVIILLMVVSIVGVMDFTMDLIPNGSANVLYVGGSGGGNYSTIQQAVNDASNEDIVFVYSGTYYENIVVNKRINLSGESRDTTLINGGGFGTVIRVNTFEVSINGFTITGSGSAFRDAAIDVYYTTKCKIFNNNISQNGNFGIFARGGSTHQIYNNIIYANSNHGINIQTRSSTLRNNIMIQDGISLTGYDYQDWNSNSIDTSNTANGKPVYYWKEKTSGTLPSEAGQIILANCTDIKVEGQIISNTSVAIQIGFSSDCFISNNTLTFNNNGIVLHRTERINITGNTIENSTFGIDAGLSEGDIIAENTVLNNEYGIFVISSHYEYIIDNVVYQNSFGIFVHRSHWIYVIANNVSDNIKGIEINASLYGINNIFNNSIVSNNNGIFLIETENNFIENNDIIGNTNGIYLGSSSHFSEIHNNTISNNYCGIFPAVGSSNNNMNNNTFSDNTVQISIDTDGDGIRDHLDEDDDDDGHLDVNDDLPTDPTEWEDTDFDGIGNNQDTDDDNDGYPDEDDEFPRDPKEWSDKDGDGIGDNSDSDNNGNYIPDTLEIPLAILAILIPVILFILINRRIKKKGKQTNDRPSDDKEERKITPIFERNK